MNKRSNRIVGLAVLAIVVLAGCSGSTSTTAPQDTVPPAAVVGVEANGMSGPSPSVTLSWAPGAEADLAGYRIYRSTAGAAAELVGETMSSHWVDEAMMTGVEHVYQVAAVDVSDNEGARTSSGVVIVVGSGHDEVD